MYQVDTKAMNDEPFHVGFGSTFNVGIRNGKGNIVIKK